MKKNLFQYFPLTSFLSRNGERKTAGAVISILISVLCFQGSVKSEDWPGYEGGNLHRNSSSQTVDPLGIELLWKREFQSAVYGSRNLVLRKNRIVLLAPDSAELVYEHVGHHVRGYISILNAADGRTLACLAVRVRKGGIHRKGYPVSLNGTDASDTDWGLSVLCWETGSGVVWLSAGGDAAYQTAYSLPDSFPVYTAGKPVEALPAFTHVPESVKEQREKNIDKSWGGNGPIMADQWWLCGPNWTGFFEADPDTGLLLKGAGFSHAQSGRPLIFDQRTGLTVDWALPKVNPVNTPPYLKPVSSVEPFRKWGGTRIGNGRIFCMGPGDDNNASGVLGDCQSRHYIHWKTKKMTDIVADFDDPDQGLHLWAYDLNSAADGTFSPRLSWIYRFTSDHKPEHGPADCESYAEMDGWHRNKVCILDEKSMWTAWMPGSEKGIVLIHASDDGAAEYPLGICRGMRGQDVWPHMSMTEVEGRKFIVYFGGNGQDRDFLKTEKPYNSDNAWGDTKPARGPAQMAVFDVTQKKVLYTRNLSKEHPTLPVNDFWFYLDRSHLVTTGKYAWIGWVNVSGEEAVLQLAAYDITDRHAETEVVEIPLGIQKNTYPAVMLTDLIAADGKLYALIHRATDFSPAACDWDQQIVCCIGIK